MATNLSRTLTTNGSRRKGTLSFWYKKCEIGTSRMLYSSFTSGGNNHNLLTNTNDTLRWASQVSSSAKINLITNRVFRDTNAWYHIVLAFDTEQGTSSNRAKMYINGVQETSFSTEVYPSQNDDLEVNKSGEHIYFNKNGDGAGMEASCVYSHIHYIDGTMYDASAFGSTDSTTGEWKINTSPSVTYGTNGFFILKDGNSVTDQSGNSNNFTVEQGTLTKTEDCPSNVFSTMNFIDNYFGSGTFSNGNNTVKSANNGYNYNTSTLGVNTGKFYWECKWSAQPTGSSNQVLIGIAKRPVPNSTTWLGSVAYTYGYQGSDGHVKVSGGNATGSSATTYAVGDIISVALDLDNNKLHFAKNGSWTNSSDPAGNSGGVTITAPDSTSGDSGFYFAAFGDGNASLEETGQFNFGNGYFGTTAVSSAGTNASGNGIFEYDVPTGYTALSTKGLNL